MSVSTDRARAIALLKEARDILSNRLTDRILESAEELLEDAMGRTFASEIDNLYEQLGQRLSHVNVLLSCLPAREEPEAVPPASPPGTANTTALELKPLELKPLDDAELFQADTALGVAALPMRAALEITALPAPVTFEQFARQVSGDDLDAAGRSLAVLFAVDEERGRRCAATFREQVLRSPDTLSKAMRLRHELRSGSTNAALLLLWECFGLQGVESVLVLQTLQARLNG